MRMLFRTGICFAALAAAALGTAQAQQTGGSKQNSGNKPSTDTAQTNSTNGQRKDGQVVHQDFGQVKASRPDTLAVAPPAPSGQGGSAGSNGAANSKAKVRQEFGPTQANKRNDALVQDTLVQAGSSSNGGKPKSDAKAQSPK